MEHQVVRELLTKLEREWRLMDPERLPQKAEAKEDIPLKRLKVGRHD